MEDNSRRKDDEGRGKVKEELWGGGKLGKGKNEEEEGRGERMRREER